MATQQVDKTQTLGEPCWLALRPGYQGRCPAWGTGNEDGPPTGHPPRSVSLKGQWLMGARGRWVWTGNLGRHRARSRMLRSPWGGGGSASSMTPAPLTSTACGRLVPSQHLTVPSLPLLHPHRLGTRPPGPVGEGVRSPQEQPPRLGAAKPALARGPAQDQLGPGSPVRLAGSVQSRTDRPSFLEPQPVGDRDVQQ